MRANQKILMTMGDPLGIGPEIICRSMQDPRIREGAEFFIIGHLACFEGLPGFDSLFQFPEIHFVEVAGDFSFETATPKTAGELSYRVLKQAMICSRDFPRCALVTAPISKSHINLCGFDFPGHTEFLCHEFKASDHAMMLVNEHLKVVLSTIHVPLSAVPSMITKDLIIDKLKLISQTMINWFGVYKPRIAVCGLNPHAGEGGMFGYEDQEIIKPAIEDYLKNYAPMDVVVEGPVSADTVFHRTLKGEFDVVLCQYHDQGLIPIKTLGFETGVNLTLGLPIIRTSPDHGTAFEIARKGVASALSMKNAVELAKKIGRNYE